MRLTRCFVPPPLQQQTQRSLPRAAALHVTRVLRLRAGARLTLFDGRGGEFEAEILAVHRDEVRVGVLAHQPIEREAPVRVALLQSVARGERMDLIVQKATELGVAAIVPLTTERSVVHLTDSAAGRRCEHWRQIAISACEQCGRNRVPTVHEVTSLIEACRRAGTLSETEGQHDVGRHPIRWILSPEAELSLAAAATTAAGTQAPDVILLVGPEGGWSTQDAAVARQFHFQPCHLGPRILRAETAPIAALALIQALAGDLR